MEPINAVQLRDMFHLLSNENQRVFIDLLAGELTGEAIFCMADKLGEVEKKRFSDLIFEHLLAMYFPIMLAEARRVAKDTVDLSDAELENELNQRIKLTNEMHDKALYELAAADFKEKRDRQSDPETIERNVEICNLRKQDLKKWTQGKLARQFNITPRMVRKILDDEQKWRRLARKRTK